MGVDRQENGKMGKWEHYDDNINLANDSDNYGGDDD